MKKKILKYVIRITQIILNDDSITEDTKLLELGMFDSIDIITLISEIESEYSIELTEEDFDLENFQTPKSITEMISKQISINGRE